MPFPEKLKQKVKRRAHFKCCLCHSIGIEIHHIAPQSEGGTDDDKNAAPLCPSCHETYGGNRTKRKFITEARDFWYEMCDSRYASDFNQLLELTKSLKKVATKKDISDLIELVSKLSFPKSSSDNTIYGWWLTVEYDCNEETAAKIVDEIRLLVPKAKVNFRIMDEDEHYNAWKLHFDTWEPEYNVIRIDIETPTFIPERCYKLISKLYKVKFKGLSYDC